MINARQCGLALGLALMVTSGALAHPNASDEIRYVRDGQHLLLNCTDLAIVLGYEFKVVTPERLATFCQPGGEGLCIPLRLTQVRHRMDGADLLVEAEALAHALGFQVKQVDNKIVVQRVESPASATDPAPPAYNAAWASGRGFGKGDVVPDIPLLDLEGNEVRFSQFLGKRYILYCWASW